MPKTNEPIQVIKVRGGKIRYRATVDVPAGLDGRRRQSRRTFDTRKQAKAFIAKTRTEVDEGRYVGNSPHTFKDVTEAWLALKGTQVRPGTVYGYRSALKPALDAFGAKPIQRIARQDIEAVVRQVAAKGGVKRTAENLIGRLRQVLDYAIDSDLIVRNPASRVQAAGKPSAPPQAFSATQFRRISIALRGNRLEAAFLLTMRGLRRSEVLGLYWTDLDLKGATLTVCRSRVEVGGARRGSTIGAPKTQRGRRTIPLDRDLVEVLKRTRAQQQADYGMAQARQGHVVIDEMGRPLRPERYSDLWRRLVVSIPEAPPLSLKAARASSVTIMRDQGVPDHHVAAWHGHDEVVMRQHYSVADDAGLRTAGEALSRAVGTASPL